MKKFKKTKEIKHIEKPEEGKKRLSGPTGFAILVILIMTASGIGFMWEGGSSFTYNGFKFNEAGNRLSTKVDGKKIEFSITPQQAAGINASNEIFWVVKNTKMVYLASDYGSTFSEGIARAQYGLKNSLEKEGTYSVYAFTGKNEFNLTEITCKNATISVPVLYFTNSSETRITYDNGCIIFEAESDFGFEALKDRLMYGFYGIIG